MAAPPLDAAGLRLARAGVPALALTGAGWAAGAAAGAAAAVRAWPVALAMWLASRVLDGLDGAVARARAGATDAGGFLDIVADFSVYAGIVLGIAIAEPGARLACAALLTAYYVSGAALLALSSLAERRLHSLGDERSIRFAGGLAEGAETIAVYVLFFLLPRYAEAIAWVFTAMVAITAAQRIWQGWRLLSPQGARAGKGGPG